MPADAATLHLAHKTHPALCARVVGLCLLLMQLLIYLPAAHGFGKITL